MDLLASSPVYGGLTDIKSLLYTEELQALVNSRASIRCFLIAYIYLKCWFKKRLFKASLLKNCLAALNDCTAPPCGEAACKQQGLPRYDAPRESLAVWKRTGSWTEGVVTSTVVQATLWDEPHATRVIFCPSRPWTRVGFLLTVVVPFPCCPWSLSPHAYTWQRSIKPLIRWSFYYTCYSCMSQTKGYEIPSNISHHLRFLYIWHISESLCFL